jgi:hypothetical protein
LAHAVNFDRGKKGLPALALDAFDTDFIHTVPHADMVIPSCRNYMAFEVVQ